MNMYRFGNFICGLREQRGMTQAELAAALDVSDKAVSKWENGQAFPRIETFERLADVLGTTMQEILSASRDGVRRIAIVNDYCPVMQVEVDGKLAVLRHGECQWMEIGFGEVLLQVRGDGQAVMTPQPEPEAGTAEKLWNRFQRLAERTEAAICLHAACSYRLTGAEDGMMVTIERDCIETEDPTWFLPSFNTAYPKVRCEGMEARLLEARAINRRDAVSAYKKMALVWALGENVLLMLLMMPFLGLFARYQCRSRVLTRRIGGIEAVRAREAAREKKRGGCLGCGAALVGLVLLLTLSGVLHILGTKQYVVAEDHGAITCGDQVYRLVEELPEDAEPVLLWNATVWEDARKEGETLWEQLLREHKVQLFVDGAGNAYLWLVEDYPETIFTDDGEDLGYGDFTEHLVYMLQRSN